MILDTNAVSAFFSGDEDLRKVVSGDRHFHNIEEIRCVAW